MATIRNTLLTYDGLGRAFNSAGSSAEFLHGAFERAKKSAGGAFSKSGSAFAQSRLAGSASSAGELDKPVDDAGIQRFRSRIQNGRRFADVLSEAIMFPAAAITDKGTKAGINADDDYVNHAERLAGMHDEYGLSDLRGSKAFRASDAAVSDADNVPMTASGRLRGGNFQAMGEVPDAAQAFADCIGRSLGRLKESREAGNIEKMHSAGQAFASCLTDLDRVDSLPLAGERIIPPKLQTLTDDGQEPMLAAVRTGGHAPDGWNWTMGRPFAKGEGRAAMPGLIFDSGAVDGLAGGPSAFQHTVSGASQNWKSADFAAGLGGSFAKSPVHLARRNGFEGAGGISFGHLGIGNISGNLTDGSRAGIFPEINGVRSGAFLRKDDSERDTPGLFDAAIDGVSRLNGGDSVALSSEDLSTLRNLSETGQMQNFVSLAPTVTVTTGDIKNDVDVDDIVFKIERALTVEIAASSAAALGVG